MAGAVAAGAIGAVSKSATLQVLLDTVFAAAAGDEVMTEEERNEWLLRYQSYQAQRRELDQHLARLTPREREVLDLLDQGNSARTIAVHLVVSLTTVRAQIRAILAKLDVKSQLEAVALLNGQSPQMVPVTTTDSLALSAR
jgi:DNA-binding NarL/FixJ family response regulator